MEKNLTLFIGTSLAQEINSIDACGDGSVANSLHVRKLTGLIRKWIFHDLIGLKSDPLQVFQTESASCHLWRWRESMSGRAFCSPERKQGERLVE